MSSYTFFIFKLARANDIVFSYDLIDEETGKTLINGNEYTTHTDCLNHISQMQKFGIHENNYQKPNKLDGCFWYELVNDHGKILLQGKFAEKRIRKDRISELTNVFSQATIVDKSAFDLEEYIIKVKLFMKYTNKEINLLAAIVNGTFLVYILAEYLLKGKLGLSMMPLMFVALDIAILLVLYSKGYNLETNRYFIPSLRSWAPLVDPYIFESNYRQGIFIGHDIARLFYYAAVMAYFFMIEGFALIPLIIFIFLLLNRLSLCILRHKFSYSLSSPKNQFEKDIASIIGSSIRKLNIIQ